MKNLNSGKKYWISPSQKEVGVQILNKSIQF